MIRISYAFVIVLISVLWLLVRFLNWKKAGTVSRKREAQLMLVYICLIVVVRFTFFPFSKVNGQVQPLVFEAAKVFPPRINLLPLVYLLDYEAVRETLINVIGNTTMFIPIGIVWPAVFQELNSPGKTIAAGVGFSLCIEILQLPFYDRVSDIDDLLLNSLGFLIGYGIYLLVKKVKRT